MILPMPDGWKILKEFGNGAHYLRLRDRVQAIITEATRGEFGDNRKWLHLSVSYMDERKALKEAVSFEIMREVKEELLGDKRYAAMVFPPKEFYVSRVGSAHPNVLHLWAVRDAEDWPLPEFSMGMGTL